MNRLVYHIASGQSFFTGVLLLIIAVQLSRRTGNVYRRLWTISLLLGAIGIAVSATPLGIGWYAVATAITLAWLGFRIRNKDSVRLRQATVVIWALLVAIELPYHFLPHVTKAAARSVSVIGDSVTAGLGDNDPAIKWPTLLATEHAIQIQDLSHAGETAASAGKHLNDVDVAAPIVVLEIGGNDLLGSTTPAQFEQDLRNLLRRVTAAERQIVMLELPLPPFHNEYGRVQRNLAKEFRVALVPKRFFLAILAADGATLDSIHLAQDGHQRMAKMIWTVLQPAFTESTEH
jgi:acyl-CoA thioesterase-1